MPLIIFVRSSILDIWTGSKNRSAMYSSKNVKATALISLS